MENRIKILLLQIGLPSVPNGLDEPLADHGLDSLMIVLSVAALEKEFHVRIPAHSVDEESFSTLRKIESLLRNLGAE